MAIRTPVNVERLVMEHLRDVDEVDNLIGQRVFTALPAEPVFELAVVTRVAGSRGDQGHLDRARISIEAWADRSNRPKAEALFEVLRGAMDQRVIAGAHDLGVVSGCEEVNALYLPDPVTSRPRYIVDFIVYTHPAPPEPPPEP